MDELQRLRTKSADTLAAKNIKGAYFSYLEVLDAAIVELRNIKFVGNVAITTGATVTLMALTKDCVVSVQEILAKHDPAIAAVTEPPTTNPPFRKQAKTPAFRKPSLARHSERISSGQARTVTMLTEQLQAAAAGKSKNTVNNSKLEANVAGKTESNTNTTAKSSPSQSPSISSTSSASSSASSSPSLPASSNDATTSDLDISQSSTDKPITRTKRDQATSTEDERPAISIASAMTLSNPLLKPTLIAETTIEEETSSDEERHQIMVEKAERTASLSEAHEEVQKVVHKVVAGESDVEQVKDEDIKSREETTTMSIALEETVILDDEPFSLDTASPMTYLPPLCSDAGTILSESNHRLQDSTSSVIIESDHFVLSSTQSSNTPSKPAQSRKLNEPRSSEDFTPDEESSDEDEDEPESQQSSSQNSHRKMSSQNIAIPQARRRPGVCSSASVPASPNNSPTNIPSTSSGSHGTTRSLSQTNYSILRNNSSGLAAVIPEGCVDPSNLVEAERINGDDGGELDLKLYGPADHLPMIPISPLRITHRSLVEKEKSWSSILEETNIKIQQLCNQARQQQQQDDSDDCSNDLEIQSLQEDTRKYTSQISNTMATIAKVRELLCRSAGITSIMEFPPYLIAYQLTLIESAIFLEIPPSALLKHTAKSPHPSITASTDFFNYLTRMIEYSILFPAEASGRAQIINHWIKVAVKLHELENFQTLKAILCALGTPPIKRLKRTWSFLPRKSINKFETLSDLMSEDRNYGKYREMMNSLWAGSIVTSPDVSSPILSDSASSMSGSGRFDSFLGSWSNSETKSKERRPMIPFLGTFIMDMTYLLAAVKKNSGSSTGSTASAATTTTTSSSSLLSKIPGFSSIRETKNLTVNTAFSPQDDARIQDLLLTLTAYQSGPRYSPQPPRAYIKASVKTQHHFRAPSLSSALQMTTKYRSNAAAAERERQMQFSLMDDDDEDFLGLGATGAGSGSGGIRSTQQLIWHYLLTRPWAPERMVDELSMIREPSKTNNSNNSNNNSSISINSNSSSNSNININNNVNNGSSSNVNLSVGNNSFSGNGHSKGCSSGSSTYSASSGVGSAHNCSSLEPHLNIGSGDNSNSGPATQDE